MTAQVHINRPSSTRYRARWRCYNARKWQVSKREHKTLAEAARYCAANMALTRVYRYGEVIVTAEYYEPLPVLKMERP